MLETLMPRGRVRVLATLLLDPEQEFYLRELATRAGVSLATAQNEVARLGAAGVLLRTQRGRRTYYRADPRSPVFPELRSLVMKTAGLVEMLREALSGERIRVAAVYGSVATGTLRKGSDVDLLVVGMVRPRAVSDLVAPVERETGREINPVVLTPREFSQRVKRQDGFLTSVLVGTKLFVIGDEDELARLAK